MCIYLYLVFSCSNDTTIKIWMLPDQHEYIDEGFKGKKDSFLRLNSFYTIDCHLDYVRAMKYSKQTNRLFSISDDGKLIVNDLN